VEVAHIAKFSTGSLKILNSKILSSWLESVM
jgi:hypothetical protein